MEQNRFDEQEEFDFFPEENEIRPVYMEEELETPMDAEFTDRELSPEEPQYLQEEAVSGLSLEDEILSQLESDVPSEEPAPEEKPAPAEPEAPAKSAVGTATPVDHILQKKKTYSYRSSAAARAKNKVGNMFETLTFHDDE